VNAGKAAGLAVVPHNNTWFRAVSPRFTSTAISTVQSKTIASRFSAASAAKPGFEVLYLAENHLVAMFEVQALFGSPLTPGGVVSNPSSSFVTLAIQTSLTAVVDLSDPIQAAVVDTNAQELTGDWRGYQLRGSATSVSGPTGKAPTQEFGEQLFSRRPDVQGFITLSARLPYYKVLGVFTQRLRPGTDYVRYTVQDPSGKPRTVQIPASS